MRALCAFLVAAVVGALPVCAVDTPNLLGAIEGQVRNEQGVTQMGATVTLVNRVGRALEQALTDANGRFRFDSLFPDSYGIRVSLSSFVPAYRSNVAVKSGVDSFLTVQLAHIFSSIELVYRPAGQSGLLSDDWRYTLRTSTATRPVLRAIPVAVPGVSSSRAPAGVFSTPQGVVAVSAGDSAGSSNGAQQADLGTAFALATSVYGRNQVQVSGNVGYSSTMGTASAALRTRYNRTGTGFVSPELELTVQQASYRFIAGQNALSGPASGRTAPLLRTMSLRIEERAQMGDNVALDYGGLMETVQFLDRLNIFSPHARLTADSRALGSLSLAYASGATPTNLLADPRYGVAPTQDSLAGLGVFPRLSLENGRVRVQGTDTLEAGYRKAFGRNAVAVAAYVENVRNPAIAVGGLGGYADGVNFLPDLGSDASIYNLGTYRAQGYMLTGERNISEHWFVAISAGEGGALSFNDSAVDSPAQIRRRFQVADRRWAAARIGGAIPKTGSFVTASYGWADKGGLAPVHAYLTQKYLPQVGVNVFVRQSLPTMGMPGRVEMNAELRNLLAQGYVPVGTTSGGLVLMQFPRTLRGGLSFIF